MEKLKIDTEKICNFYVSEWHLVTMILPYINQKLNEKANIIPILEKDIEENIKILTSKLNLKNTNKILEIEWKPVQGVSQSIVNKKLYNITREKVEDIIIFVSGSKCYIDFVNQYINSFIEKSSKNIKKGRIKIINCYEVTEFNGNIHEILNYHDKILNTSGEKQIYEVFDGYTKQREIC